ncbi:MAG: histidine kinase [Bacteroidetes bacterium]|nr:histidine kinase [Bacteroidota bacterium]
MHPILSERKRIFIYLSVWIGLGILFSFVLKTLSAIPAAYAAVIALPMFVVLSQLNLSAWFLAKVFPPDKSELWKLFSALAVSTLLISGIWGMLCWGWVTLLERYFSVQLFSEKTAVQFGIVVLISAQLYLLSVGLSYFFMTFETSRTAERNALELQLLAQNAELKALRMQINPHFLFNSLNSINALISRNPEKAREMTTLLADFFRKSLQFGAKEMITLGEEVSLLNNYLAIETIRFGSRLTIEQNIEPPALAVRVPPLILQPLLENAVKHGIADSLSGGTIRISAEQKNEQVFVVIENPVDDDGMKKKGIGLGLENVRRRLQTVFHDTADLQTYREGSTFRTLVYFPMNNIFAEQ